MKIAKIIKSSTLYQAYRNCAVAIRQLNKNYRNENHYPKWKLYGSLCCAVAFRKFRADEFIYLHYMEHTWKERKQFVPSKERYQFMKQLNYSMYSCDILDTKKKESAFFKKYYQRDTLAIDKDDMGTDESMKALKDFVERNRKFIIKPLDGFGGKCVKIVNMDELDQGEFDSLVGEFEEGFIVETLIKQSDFVAKFHPESVNTVRINTVRYDDGTVDVLWPCLRFGRGASVVDNAASGGTSVALDPVTGISIGAADENGNSYTMHPDYGFPLVGFQMPDWNQACDLVRKLALMLPNTDCRLVGWDLALTDEGWMMVEANSLPSIIWQIAAGRGVRSDFERIKKAFGL